MLVGVAKKGSVMDKIRFSVLVPVYNVEKYLRECIDSVLKQTYQNWELILIDDGSTDSSGKICDEYAKEYTNIIVIHNQNKGLLLSRRDAIKKSRGDFLLFLDSDDCLRNDALCLLSKIIYEYDSDLVFFNASIEKGYSKACRNYQFYNKQVFYGEEKACLYKLLITTNDLNNMCFKAIKRTIVNIEDEYISYSFVRNGEDLLQSLPIIDKAKKISYLDAILYYYRQHTDSITHKKNPTFYHSIKAVREEVEKYAIKWQMEKYFPAMYALNLRECLSGVDNIRHSTLTKKQKIEKIKEIARDSFFVNSFKRMDTSQLKKVDYFIAKLLYRKQIHLVLFVQWLREKRGRWKAKTNK